MKGPLKQVCFACHDDFLGPAKFKHQPADDGDCLECHNPHQSEFKGLLKQGDPQVCYECHEPADLAGVKAHTAAAGAGCVKCHDPHAGKDKYFLKPDAGLQGTAPSR
jgi:predicted CXXCH cytochrome family protein